MKETKQSRKYSASYLSRFGYHVCSRGSHCKCLLDSTNQQKIIDAAAIIIQSEIDPVIYS